MAEFLSHPIPAVVIMLGILVAVHEFGHYLVGRLCGIAVETFSIGFGPRILGFRKNGIDYRFSWLPLGGYVKFAGAHPSEDLPAEMNGIPYRAAPTWKRALTIMAGPFANFLLAVAVYAVLGFAGIQHPPAQIGEVIAGSAADQAGIVYGDKITAIDGKPIETWRDMEQIIASSPGKELALAVDRAGQQQTIKLTPATIEAPDMLGKPAKIGRAGIALGSLPAIVSIELSNSPAAQAGLRTGDKITEIAFDGQTRPVRNYPELVTTIEEAYQNENAQSLQLTVEEAPLPGAGQPDKAARRNLVLDARVIKDVPGRKDGRLVLSQLGIRDSQLTVAEATETVAGVLQKGDVLDTWKGQPVKDVYQLRELLMTNDQQVVPVTVSRAGEQKSIAVSLKPVEMQRPAGPATVYALPVVFWGQPQEPEPLIERYTNPIRAFGYGVHETWNQTLTLVDNVTALVTGQVPLKALGGPMLIAKVAGESAKRGWQTFVGSMALISINLGLLNLFPIPVLDGGQLILIAAEAVKRRPLRERAVENFQKVGFAMILALVVLATYNDLSRFWKSMLASVSGMFQ